MKLQGMNPRLRELVALAVLAAFGCGLALSQGDLLFVVIFGAACAVTVIEAMRVCGER
jgi:alkylhydroperoxidase/carboxymuconolactone decarboxylase family protein YurZ